jgi:polyhydroxybutyrate depolymerase
MRLMVRAAVLLGLLVGLCRSCLAEELQIDMRDGSRTAILRPAPRGRAPTVIVLHGALISAEYTELWYGFAEAAAKHGFAIAYPRGLGLQWNDGRQGVWGSTADDVGFLKRLARELVTRGVANPDRLYLAGVSNGGMMALRMLCEAPDQFAGIATVIASMPELVGARCRARAPKSNLMFKGTADPVVPYRGGDVGFSGLQGRVWSAERTAVFLAGRNGCKAASKALVSGRPVQGTMRVVKLDWRRCGSERGVTLYRVEGGGHQVFGSTNFLPFLLGSGTRRVSAPDVIMAAFAKGEL